MISNPDIFYNSEIGPYSNRNLTSEQREKRSIQIGNKIQRHLETNKKNRRKYREYYQKLRNELFEINIRLAGNFIKRIFYPGVDINEVQSEAYFGLYRATKDFDPKKGRFSTHANTWMSSFYRKYRREKTNRAMHIGNDVIYGISHITDSVNDFQNNYGRRPNDEEIFEALKKTSMKDKSYQTIRRIVKGVRVARASLKSPDSVIPTDKLSDSDPLENLIKKEEAFLVESLLYNSDLNENEKKVISYRYGLQGYSELTLEKISEKQGLTRERIRQIQNSALKKMRKTAYETRIA